MKSGLLVLVVALTLSGCASPAISNDVGARDAATASIDAVAGQFDYLLFLGITGTEGPLNWTLYEEALSTSVLGSSIADAFDQDADNGAAGDGRLGSWLTTHFVFDEDRQLLGGLYTQYSSSGVESVYAPFRGPYAGTPGLPALQQQDLALFSRQADEGPALCGLVSSMDGWDIGSEDAAQIAAQRSLMQAHVAAYPTGEFTYYYFPKLDVEPGCPAELTTRSNYWIISHVDLDEYLEGGIPTMAEVIIDAATGEVIDESVRPLYQQAPTVYDLTIRDQDPMQPRTAPVTRNASFIVDPLVKTLDINVLRVERPDLERAASTRLLDPSGRVWDSHTFDDAEHAYRVTSPTPGRWTLEYIHKALQPNGVHEVEVHAVATYT